MDEKGRKEILTQEDIMKILDECYVKCLDGVPMVSKSVEELANEYISKYDSREKACKEMIKNQIIKCTTSGALTGFGGIITLPVSIPANIGSVLYVQMRMISCTAYMAGYDIKSDQTQSFIYACLAGVAVNQLVKQAGVKIGVKLANSMITKIPGKVLVKINQKVGFRLVTKFGTKGVVNLGKMIPGVGAVVGGGLDLFETKAIGDRAYKWFFENDFSVKESDKSEEVIIDVDVEDVMEENS